jgi:hypothetical protein
VISLITTGDAAASNPYRMVGIPDGLGAIAGAYSERLGTYVADRFFMTVFMNHELGATSGSVRAHGQAGALVSQWTINLQTLKVFEGQDLIERVLTWQNGAFADTTGQTAFARFCSGDLPESSAFYDTRSGKGFYGRIYMNGEEAGAEGRAFAHVVTGQEKGTTYELPYLGKFSWENSVASPESGQKTIVVGLDDSTPGQVYVYVGEKQRYGNPVERAGLQNGKLYGVRVVDGGANYGGAAVPLENKGPISGKFTLADVSAYALGSGAGLDAASDTLGVTELARPEDGAWDPTRPNDFYFVTTGASGQTARLYRLSFDSVKDPTGGRIELVVDSKDLVGTDGETARSFDNLTVDADGNVLVQEDPGGVEYIAKTWKIDPKKPKEAVQILESNRDFFASGGANFRTTNEESSGIIEVTDIVRNAWWYERGRRYYLADMQDHTASSDPELVEGGQLYLVAGPRQKDRGHDRRDDD